MCGGCVGGRGCWEGSLPFHLKVQKLDISLRQRLRIRAGLLPWEKNQGIVGAVAHFAKPTCNPRESQHEGAGVCENVFKMCEIITMGQNRLPQI